MPFEKGKSGNPAGRPKGVPDRRQVVRDLLLPSAPQLVSKAVEKALQGDSVMLKVCLDKLIPNARPQSGLTYDFDGDAASCGRSVVEQVGSGVFTVEQGRAVLDLLAVQTKLEEQAELIARVSALEEALNVD